tara:strand:- start:5708 stop:5962 length:255 start_codon:yes stop_codon:yes gene_type:complete
MNILDEAKKFININVEIKKEAVAELVHDKVLLPLLEKAVDIIPTELDNAYFESKKVEIKLAAVTLIVVELTKLEEKIKEALSAE